MAEAIISGLIKSEALEPAELIASDVNNERLKYIQDRYGIDVSTENAIAAAKADFVLLAIKPQQFDEVVQGFQNVLSSDQILVTIAAGVSTTRARALIDQDVAIVRVMPNTPALVNAGISAVALPSDLSPAKRNFIEKILMSVGEVVYVDESDMDAVTAVSGSGPAYFFLFVRELIAAGIEVGLDPELAARLARHTFFGSARLLQAGSEDESSLIEAVASPGGTTEAALRTMEAAEFGDIIRRGVQAAAARSRELAH
jgi:pyrroline-5-carboxylate reductase